MQDFRKLKVWQEAHRVTLDAYAASQAFPSRELYGVTSQLRRAVVSIAANIAEGCGRGGDRDFARFLQIAMGSACEAEYFLLLARDLRMLETTRHQQLWSGLIEVKKMLVSLISKLRAGS
jgi:four helix bundle protein